MQWMIDPMSCPADVEASMTGRYQGHVIDMVAQAAANGETLHIRETARRIAATTESFSFLDAIADALVQESVRQRASFEMNQSCTPRPS